MLKAGLAAVVAGALMLVSGPAQAADLTTSTAAQVHVQDGGIVQDGSAETAVAAQIVANVRSEQAAGFNRGDRATVYKDGAVTVDLVRTRTGAYQLVVDSGVAPVANSAAHQLQATAGVGLVANFNFCHAAAMAAVYTIGAAAFLAASLVGGIVVFGVAISAEAAGAMSAALALGAGVSALVSLYIC